MKRLSLLWVVVTLLVLPAAGAASAGCDLLIEMVNDEPRPMTGPEMWDAKNRAEAAPIEEDRRRAEERHRDRERLEQERRWRAAEQEQR